MNPRFQLGCCLCFGLLLGLDGWALDFDCDLPWAVVGLDEALSLTWLGQSGRVSDRDHCGSEDGNGGLETGHRVIPGCLTGDRFATLTRTPGAVDAAEAAGAGSTG